jgi:hypothetical protein
MKVKEDIPKTIIKALGHCSKYNNSHFVVLVRTMFLN